MFVSFYTELGNSSIADERVFLLHFILQQGKISKLFSFGLKFRVKSVHEISTLC